MSELKIVTPVSRFLGAADQAQTMAFYRDVLGFDVRQSDTEPQALEVHSGPARILFGPHESGPEGQDDPHPGPAVVFFEINNVEGFHTDVRTRGGNPSSLQHVNGIQMRVFEVRDPDGHTLWFGQAFVEPEKPPPPGLLEKIMPEFPLSDVPSGVEYYRNALGFSVNYEQADLAVMDRDDVRLLLVARTERHKGIGSAYVYVHNADELHAKLRRHGARIQGAPISQPWGLREFRVLDVEGNQITFGQPFE